jgi:hypothetical protein
MGRLAVTLLLHRLEFEDESFTSTLVRPQLIERQSVRTLGVAARQDVIAQASESAIGPDPRPVSAAEPVGRSH